MKWRTGRKVGRTIYLQRGDQPSDGDDLIGVLDTSDLARTVVEAVNQVGKHLDPWATPPELACGHGCRGDDRGLREYTRDCPDHDPAGATR